jgi:hypothetical protein
VALSGTLASAISDTWLACGTTVCALRVDNCIVSDGMSSRVARADIPSPSS